MYRAPGQGQTTPWGQNVFINKIFCPFAHFLQVLPFKSFQQFSPFKCMGDLCWPCRKIGHGHPRVMIYRNFVELHCLMLHNKFQNHRPSGSGEEDFFFFFAIYSHGGHLGHVTWTIYTNFRSPTLRMLHMKFGFDWPSGFRGEDVWKVWTMTTAKTDDGAWVSYKLTCEPSAQVS